MLFRGAQFAGLLIVRTFLVRNPPADDARLAADFICWGDNLMADGQRRLDELGVRTLRSVQNGGDA